MGSQASSHESLSSTFEPEVDEYVPALETNQKQLGFLGIAWITIGFAALLAYAKSLGVESLSLLLVYCGFIVVAAFAGAVISGRWTESFYWSALFSILAFLAIAGARMIDPSVAIAWGGVGASCGAWIGSSQMGSTQTGWLRLGSSTMAAKIAGSIVTGLLAVASMLAVLLFLKEPLTSLIWFDVAFSFLIGALLRPLHNVLRWAEIRSGQHRVILASWLAACILVGNALVPLLAGTTR